MVINGNEIVFYKSDMFFVEQFGIEKATDIVFDYSRRNNTPFIYDTYQLAEVLFVDRKDLFRFVKNIDSLYKSVTIKKKNGKQRKLNVPTEELKTLQRYVLKNILCYLPVSRYATAYKKGVSLTDNASPHVNKKYILKMDVTDFFGSITFDQVYNAAFNTKLYPKQIGYMLTCLCCHKDVLPQGAPTSPAVSNLVMKHFDDTIGAWCNKRGIAYTRYCDDMTFSADKPLYAVYEKARSMLENIGMELNEKKTCFVSHGARQAVTGLVVNEKVSVPREYKRKVRQELYYLYKYGAEICRIQTLIGKIRYIISVEKNNNIFINELDRLMEYKANLD